MLRCKQACQDHLRSMHAFERAADGQMKLGSPWHAGKDWEAAADAAQRAQRVDLVQQHTAAAIDAYLQVLNLVGAIATTVLSTSCQLRRPLDPMLPPMPQRRVPACCNKTTQQPPTSCICKPLTYLRMQVMQPLLVTSSDKPPPLS